MVQLPLRKCYHAAKVCVFVVVVVTMLVVFEQWRGGKRSARAQFLDTVDAEYERQVLKDEARIVPGLGDGGEAVQLVGEEKRLGEASEKKLAINVYLSDKIPYNRTLKGKCFFTINVTKLKNISIRSYSVVDIYTMSDYKRFN